MSLTKNIAANYASQIYIAAVGVLLVPQYMKYLGAEAYGLVAFFSMLQAWFNLLDIGLTPTVARETAKFKSGRTDSHSFICLTYILVSFYFVTALVGGLVLFFLASWFSVHWLNPAKLPIGDLVGSLRLMAGIVALRWMCGIFRGVIGGSECLVWLSGCNSIIATCRFILVLPVLVFWGATPVIFFSFQLIVAVIEVGVLFIKTHQMLPAATFGDGFKFDWFIFKPILKFSLSVAFTSSAWVFVTQTDKLILSKILPLGDYGYFTVAVLVASGVSILSGPISAAIMPRMAHLQFEGKNDQLISIYRKATQLTMVISMPVALVLIFFPSQVLWAWTGNSVLTQKAASVLRLYSIGYAFLAPGAFPYYLQYAKGNLKLHLIGNVLFIICLIPSVIWAAFSYGMVGAGWAWVAVNGIYFFTWIPFVHRRFAVGLHFSWLFRDVLKPVGLTVLFSWICAVWLPWSSGRLLLTIELVVVGFILLLTSWSQTSRLRRPGGSCDIS